MPYSKILIEYAFNFVTFRYKILNLKKTSKDFEFADSGCTIIKVLNINLINYSIPATVTKIQGGETYQESVFYPCRKSIKTVTFESASTLTTLGKFLFCNTALESIDFSNCGSLTSLSFGIFLGCYYLNDIVLPPNLNTIDKAAFTGCSALTTITIPDSVTKIEDFVLGYTSVFGGCVSLKSITLSKNSKLEFIGSHAFMSSGLESIYIPRKVNSIGSSPFLGTPLKEIDVDPLNPYFSTDGIALFQGKTIITVVPSYSGEYSIAGDTLFYFQSFRGSKISKIKFLVDKNYQLYDFCFASTSFTTIDLPSKITIIPSYCFSESSLESIVIPAETILIYQYAFSQCPNLTSIKLSPKLTTLHESVFRESNAFLSITIPASVTTFGQHVFKKCNKDLVVNCLNPSKFKVDNLLLIVNGTKIVDYYDNDPNATLIVPSYCTSIVGNAFEESELESVEFEKNSLCSSFSNSAFKSSKVKTIKIPLTVKDISASCFENCDKLTSVIFERILFSNAPFEPIIIRERCFFDCSSLETIMFPAALKNIETNAFFGCSSLKTVKYCGQNHIKTENVFDSSPNVLVTELYTSKTFCSLNVIENLPIRCIEEGVAGTCRCFKYNIRSALKPFMLLL